MKTIKTELEVTEEHTLRIAASRIRQLKPGIYHAVLVLDDQPIQSQANGQSTVEPVELTFPSAVTTLDEVAGCLRYTGKPKTLQEMQQAIAEGVKERYAERR